MKNTQVEGLGDFPMYPKEVAIEDCPRLLQALMNAKGTKKLELLVASEIGVQDPSLHEANEILEQNELLVCPPQADESEACNEKDKNA